MTPEKSALVIYQTDDGKTRIDVRLDNETLWLTQAQMAELFQRDRSVITRHINNAISEGELDKKSNVHFMHFAHSDKPVAFYNLDAIIAVGYRVKPLRGTQFRRWATGVLHEYLVKGFAMNDELLKDMGGGRYWKELLERIRRYVREEGWQVAAIEEGVRQADAGDFATEEEVKAAFAQWGVDVRTGRFSKCAA